MASMRDRWQALFTERLRSYREIASVMNVSVDRCHLARTRNALRTAVYGGTSRPGKSPHTAARRIVIPQKAGTRTSGCVG
jgi:hypothetical protein